eukprot:SAG31_NODE_6456_length_2011_cov_2.029812_1_plen_508_part_10
MPELKARLSESFESSLSEAVQPPATKTFLERRGILHSFKANFRVFFFYAVFFHLLLLISVDVPFAQDWLPLCPLPDQGQDSGNAEAAWDQSSPVQCDLDTASCSYTNVVGQLFLYDCLDGMTKNQRKHYHSIPTKLGKYNFFDSEWSDYGFARKLEYYSMQPASFTCGYNKTTDEIEKAGNQTFCCRVTLQNNSSVWAETRDCNDGVFETVWKLLPQVKGKVSAGQHHLRMNIFAVALTVATFRLVEELLRLWISWGIIRSQGMRGGTFFRLATRFSCFAILIVLNSVRWAKHPMDTEEDFDKVYAALSILFTLPEIVGGCAQLSPVLHTKCSALFDRLGCRVLKYHNVMGQLRTSAKTHAAYSLTWLSIIVFKCWFSYTFELRLAIKDSATIWQSMSNPVKVEMLENPITIYVAKTMNGLDGCTRLAVLLVFWIPTALVFLIDAQVLFTLGQMFVGLLVGWRNQVGGIHNWLTFKQRFGRMRECMGARLSATPSAAWKEVLRHRQFM